MKHQDQLSFVTDDQAEQMGADMAIQFMLMMLFQLVSEMADDPRGFRADIHRELSDLVATYKLPSMPADTEQKSRRGPQDTRRHHAAIVRTKRDEEGIMTAEHAEGPALVGQGECLGWEKPFAMVVENER